jgi:hypothetical protein
LWLWLANGAGHLFHLESPALNVTAGVRYTATAREGEAQWCGRFSVTLLFSAWEL